MAKGQSAFIRVEGTQFRLKGSPYYFMGTNFWYGMNLGIDGPDGDRARLLRELDHLKSLGVRNLRIMGASEGPDDEPWRMLPSMQPEKGVYNAAVVDGLDFLIAEMAKRKMYAVVCLNNFWPWSGGMAQYLNWEDGDQIPYPPPAKGGDWAKYMVFTTKFYKNKAAQNAFQDHLKFLIERVNPYTQRAYKDEPAIMAWELANEPRGILRPKSMIKWIDSTAALIKSLDPNHLVTVGSEGSTNSKFAGTNFELDHKSPHIDYATIHIWVQNWGWYQPEKPRTYEKAERKARKYIRKHIRAAESLGMPVVLEEFGISRDGNSHDAQSKVSFRDKYYQSIFDLVYRQAVSGKAIAGCNFWAWGGEGRPSAPKAIWKAGDAFIGDPPHEHQGWYSIYDRDKSTLEIIAAYAKKLRKIGE